ncbi:alpha/beta hydrolase [Bordetella genomosp. 9]|uniref:alpha/beta hydrolase n=1 Tax=Bordetella genomosp. 9 TaxID=1416803 RepID=UPI0027961E16|nr:alpha/beta hydrolase [Bordetella genomosp. 9]
MLASPALIALVACSPLKVLNAFVPDNDGVRVIANMHYGTDPRQSMDVYVPRDVAAPPVVVFFYGGSWSGGSRAQYRFVGDALATRGILAVVADYRVYPLVTYPAFVEDAAAVVAWTLRNISTYGGDPRRVFVAGHSAGAYNAAMVALDPRWLGKAGATPAMLAGWIGIAGPYDFLPIVDEDIKPIFAFPNTPPDSQPLAYVSPSAPPTLLIAGTSDRVVDPVRNTDRLADALRAAHVPVLLKRYTRVGHGLAVGAFAWPLRWTAPVLEDVTDFVKTTPAGHGAGS